MIPALPIAPPDEPAPPMGIRTMLLTAYEIPRSFYGATGSAGYKLSGGAAYRAGELGALLWYTDRQPHTGRKRRPLMDIDAMVSRWHEMIAGLATAHDKDEADRIESSIEECLSPILTAPVRQLREFAPKLLESLKADRAVPFLVWRAYEVWAEQMKAAPDEDVISLKTEIAKDIVTMVEADCKSQLPDAMVRALQWRSPAKLEEVRTVVRAEKAAGRPVHLRGRESCLFLEAGGTIDKPAVCVQV
jgi:hypothetical protein